MAFRFNPTTGQLDLVNSTGITGPASSTDKAIVRWNGTTGQIVQDGPGTYVQDSGAIEAQAFVFNRQILNDVLVPDKFSVISTDVELISGDILLEGDAELVLI